MKKILIFIFKDCWGSSRLSWPYNRSFNLVKINFREIISHSTSGDCPTFHNSAPLAVFPLLKPCPHLLAELGVVQFLDLILQFFPIFGPKYPFFLLKLSPCLFLWPEKSFFSLKLVNFWTLFSNVFAIFGPKNSFFMLKLSPRLFFGPEKSFHFFFENFSIFGLYTQFSPQLFAQPCFFWPEKSLFFFFI